MYNKYDYPKKVLLTRYNLPFMNDPKKKNFNIDKIKICILDFLLVHYCLFEQNIVKIT